MRINIESYISETEDYKQSVKELLLELEECYLGANTKKRNKEYVYKLSLKIIQELFNPYNLYSEPLIPISFFKTTIGKTLISILYEEEERVLTIQDIVNMSKSKDKPKGYSYQYINNEIKLGRLKAERYHGRWVINIEDAKTFIESKKKKKQ